MKSWKSVFIVLVIIAVTALSGCNDESTLSSTTAATAEAEKIETATAEPEQIETATAEPEQPQEGDDWATVEFSRSSDGGEEDCISPDVCLWRDQGGPIVVRGEGQIEWACGQCGPNMAEWYPQMGKAEFKDACFDGNHKNVPGTDTCLHLIDEDQYWDVHWLGWGSGGSGGTFSYIRYGPVDVKDTFIMQPDTWGLLVLHGE